MSKLLTLHRDFTLSTLYGHVIVFAKGKPTHVPAMAHAAAIAVGAVAADGSDADVIPADKEHLPAPSGADRNLLILTAIEELVAKNDRKDFTAAGQPAVKAVERVLGFDVDGREVAVGWQELHEKKAAQ